MWTGLSTFWCLRNSEAGVSNRNMTREPERTCFNVVVTQRLHLSWQEPMGPQNPAI